MSEGYKDKRNHLMWGINHRIYALRLISKPGSLNPMFGRVHNELMFRKQK